MQPTTTPRAAASAALGEDVREWIERQRNTPAKLSYRQIADTLSAETGVTVTREALRQWHSEIHAGTSAA
ncbi:hypothetical protein FFI94_022070 [Rhodococcus sp. KBS0724]|uniref:helix-turn-helix domain-containing protein n=1 Tax=Rhodococcus sp. KBS0724 TaxID=1179674 RepID=UPI00110EDA02|nr:helix-turn-helix domain-containing protein [Rhodococcus sp. KBS0724]TSD48553.1 hypothetical protein FFI94_022070 [Rhodococcus sp. KBS0724]